jgi:hypothetical protein
LNRLNERATPAVVARHNGDWVVGQPALDLRAHHPQIVVCNPLESLAINAVLPCSGEAFPSEDALAALLTGVREDAEYRLGERVTDAVLAVPSALSPALHARLRTVAVQAQWPVRQIISDSVAAVLAWRDSLLPDERMLLAVLDCNSSRFSASLVLLEPHNVAHLHTVSRPALGTERYREAIVEYALARVQQDHQVDGRQQSRFLLLLQHAADRAIQELTTQPRSGLVIIGALRDNQGDMLDVEVDLAHAEYERLIALAVDEAMACTEQVLADVGVTREQVDQVLLIGPGAKTTLLQREVARKFGAAKVIPGIDPEEAVAFGAARLAQAHHTSLQVDYPVDARALLAAHFLVEPAVPAVEPPPASVASEPGVAQAEEPAQDPEPAAVVPQIPAGTGVDEAPGPATDPPATAEQDLDDMPAAGVPPQETAVPEVPNEPIPATEPTTPGAMSDAAVPIVAAPLPRPPAPGGPSLVTDATPVQPQQDLTRLGRYHVVRRLGEDTYYTCYLAEELPATRSVRLKVYPAGDEGAKRAFARALTVYHLRHPSVEAILDFGMQHDALFVVTDGTDNMSLRELLRSHGQQQPLPIKQALEIALGLCEALRVIHGVGLFHRNLKPENILVTTPGNTVQLAGFEVCCLLAPHQRTHTMAGTLLYMAPESLQGAADCRADLYSAAVVLYEMVTGTAPFRMRQPERVKAHVLNTTPPPPMTLNPAVSRELNVLIMRGLEKAPTRRTFRAQDVEQILHKGPVA